MDMRWWCWAPFARNASAFKSRWPKALFVSNFISCFVNISIVPSKFLATWSEEAMGWLNSVMLLSSIGDCANGRMMMAELLVHGPFLCFLPQDVKKCLMKCGVEDKVQVFLFCCLAILSSTFFPFVVKQARSILNHEMSRLRWHPNCQRGLCGSNQQRLEQPSAQHVSWTVRGVRSNAFQCFASSFWLQVAMCQTCMQTRFCIPHCIWQNEYGEFIEFISKTLSVKNLGIGVILWRTWSRFLEHVGSFAQFSDLLHHISTVWLIWMFDCSTRLVGQSMGMQPNKANLFSAYLSRVRWMKDESDFF